MNFTRWTTVAIFAAMLHLQAQTPTPTQAPAPTTGPTMEQTIAFINDAYVKQDDVRYQVSTKADEEFKEQALVSEGPCNIRYEYRISHFDSMKSQPYYTSLWSQRLFLDQADPRTIATVPKDVNPPIFRVIVKPNGKQPHVFSDGEDQGFKPDIILGVFFDKDKADRVAKAYIHAIVLCHKPEAPSPF